MYLSFIEYHAFLFRLASFFLNELRISNRNCEVRVNFHPTTVTGLKICAFLIQILCLHHKKIDDNLQINMHTYDR